MTIDERLISRLEQLARLELSAEETSRLTVDLNNILTMVEKLQELDTTGVEPLVYINEEVNVLREDEVKNQVSQAEALENAPKSDGTYFRVPKVVDLK
jgi:aspartyl-tRNA(Asn)/glutamyl-tRNA(Gln) amidotransferase subunit C